MRPKEDMESPKTPQVKRERNGLQMRRTESVSPVGEGSKTLAGGEENLQEHARIILLGTGREYKSHIEKEVWNIERWGHAGYGEGGA